MREATLTIDGHAVPVVKWEYEAPIEYVRSIGAMLPDPSWSATDAGGHQHRWERTGRDAMGADDALPTLVRSSRDVPCDGSCGGTCGGEGYTVIVYHCRLCGNEVKPGLIPDHEAREVGVPIQTGPHLITLTVPELPPGMDETRFYAADFEGRTGKAFFTGQFMMSSDGSEYKVDFCPEP